MRHALWLLPVSLALALAIPFVVVGPALMGTLLAFPGGYLTFMLGMIGLCWIINAWRLRLLLAGHAHAVSPPQALATVMATEFAFCATPGGSGGPITLYGLLVRRGVPASRATAVFAADQLTDLVFFLVALLFVAVYATVALLDSRLDWLIGTSIALLSIVLALAWLWLRHTSRFLAISGQWLAGLRLPWRLRFGLARRLLRFRRALLATLGLSRRRLALVFMLCCSHWLLRYSVLYLVIEGLGHDVAWAWTFLVQMLSMAAGQVSMLPGGLGGAELASTALLTPLIGLSQASVAVLIWRFVTFHFYLLAGAPVFVCLFHRQFLLRRRLSWRR
ncbi:lysylphosphatidylglycerol synthase transmembrane domain-containing protein [Modicisalibacter luteus]|uniref:YbhN family protein n=1 Tax=Modicisalibacter luteus TaxID=453962 RepID=A0ABV7LYF5_9GAMM|nr:lysylphosphatidylglycerol synthase transmembrane domain-containing protein [Halomonas lutea]GHB02003.1 hypothetical protein GCM10007159_24860 [Halomonas lutea]